MRKIVALILIVAGGMLSCSKTGFLDDKSSTLIDENAVFTDSTRTMAFLSRMYEEIGFNFNKGRWEGSGTTEQAGDDSEYSLANPARRTVALYLGAYGPNQFIHADAWDLPWNNIRRANLLLSKLSTVPLSEAMRNRVRGECKFMRAYFYTYLVINFGGVPLIDSTIFTKDDNINLPRNSFEECVNYCIKELDEAAALLPIPNVPFQANTPLNQTGYEDRDFGRVTKGACMAIKVRLLLHAASPLFNGGAIASATDAQKKVAGYPSFSAARWQAAADAAKALMNTNYYSLFEDNTKPGLGFYNVFLKRVNPEYILFVNRPANRDFEATYLMPSRGVASPSVRPTQNLVDCFPMKNGKAITDPTSGYNPAFPYFNRDPRFNYTIIFNGSRYQRANTGQDTVFTYLATGSATNIANTSGDGYVVPTQPPNLTGYYCRKMCDSNIANNSSGLTERGWPLIRHAEIILSYAEAINETGQTSLAVEEIKKLRARAGIDAGIDGRYGIKTGISTDEMRTLIRNERRIEMVFEGDIRWNDDCRWKVAVQTHNGTNRIMVITRNPATKAYTYTEDRALHLHVFKEQQYLFPIPALEIRKMPLMIQNPGW